MAPSASRLGRAQTFDAHVAKLIKVFEEVAAIEVAPGAAFGRSSPGAGVVI